MAKAKIAAQSSCAPSLPLEHKRIVITRPRAQVSSLAERIEELGGEVIEFPTIQIEPPESYSALDKAVADIQSYDWVIFTSVNGVAQFFTRMKLLNKSVAELKRVEVAAIGPETAKQLQGEGVQCRFVPKQYQAEGLLDAMIDRNAGKALGSEALEVREVGGEVGADLHRVTCHLSIVMGH